MLCGGFDQKLCVKVAFTSHFDYGLTNSLILKFFFIQKWIEAYHEGVRGLNPGLF